MAKLIGQDTVSGTFTYTGPVTSDGAIFWNAGYAADSSGTVNELGAYINTSQTGTRQVKIALYDSSRNLIASTAAITFTGQQWEYSAVTPVAVTLGETYYLSIISNWNYPNYGTPDHTVTTGSRRTTNGTDFATIPDPLPAGSTINQPEYALVANGDVSGGGPTIDTNTATANTTGGFTLNFNTDTANGTAYYVVYADGRPAPSAEQIVAQTDGGDLAALKFGSMTINSIGAQSFPAITGLNPGTVYDYSIVHYGNP